MFIKTLVKFLSDANVIPPEVRGSDRDRQKTYLQFLPDDPPKVVCVRWYHTDLPSMVGKEAGVYRIQIIFRNPKHGELLKEITALWQFLVNRPEPIEDVGDGYFAIFDCQEGPIPLNKDQNGNYLYSLNFPVTSKIN